MLRSSSASFLPSSGASGSPSHADAPAAAVSRSAAPADDVRGSQPAIARAKRPRTSTIQIRLPNEDDWPAIRRLVRLHHEQTEFAHLPFSEAKYEALERQARQTAPHQCLIVAERHGQLDGMAWFSAGEHVLGDGGVLTTVHLIAVDVVRCRGFAAAKTFMRLIKGVRLWSEARGSFGAMIHVTTGNNLPSTDRLIRSTGARCLGGSYLLQANEHS